MTHELPLNHYSRPWLSLLAAKAGIRPTSNGQRWLLHLTPCHPGAKTTTLQVRWSGSEWQLLDISNAGDWSTMNAPVDEICFDSERRCFWRGQAGPVAPSDQTRILASFLADLQRACTHFGFVAESDPLPHQEKPNAQRTGRH